jgi:hypothetical protein
VRDWVNSERAVRLGGSSYTIGRSSFGKSRKWNGSRSLRSMLPLVVLRIMWAAGTGVAGYKDWFWVENTEQLT